MILCECECVVGVCVREKVSERGRETEKEREVCKRVCDTMYMYVRARV